MDRSYPEPLIFVAWTHHLMATLLKDKLGDAFTSYNGTRPKFILRALKTDLGWCNNILTRVTETCMSRVELAIDRAVEELRLRFGNDIIAWKWGAAHKAVFAHNILGKFPFLGSISEGRIATDGGDHTLNRGQT